MKSLPKLLLLLCLSLGASVHGQTRVACIGNSVTSGYLLADPARDCYPSLLQRLLGKGYQVGNFGATGATLLKKGHKPYHRTKEFEKLLLFRPDIAIIHLGLNDTDPRNWPGFKDGFKADYQWLIDTLRKTSPNIRLYLCKLTPIFSGHPRFKTGTRDWHGQIQQKIVEISNTGHLPLIDLDAALSNRPDLFADNLHPNSEGAGIIARTVYGRLTGDFGGLRLDALFTDHMVVQRDVPIPIYGTGNADDLLQVSFNGSTRHIKVGQTGKWRVMFPAMKFGGPFILEIVSRARRITINDILVGDVWLCSGQSNMAFPLGSSATAGETLGQISQDLPIRLLKFKLLAQTDDAPWDRQALAGVNALAYFSGSWTTLDSGTASGFSAIGYYFGEKIAKRERIPIGLIQMAVGGSTLESWIDRKTLAYDNLMVDGMDNWRKSDFMMDWARGRADQNLKNAVNPRQRHPFEPAYNYEAGISKLVGSPIKGVIWYQGESNVHNVELFGHGFPLLVKSWRGKWGADLPFYYVQLSSLDRPSWVYFRDAQREIQSSISNSGMAVSSDLGDSLDVHPVKKMEIGQRLGLLALEKTYHRHVWSNGPVALRAVRRADHITITFAHARRLRPGTGTVITGFELGDDRGNRLPVRAAAAKNRIHLVVPKELAVDRVYYGWQPFTRANLVNQAALPASTFSIAIK